MVGVFVMMSYLTSLGSMLAFVVACAATPPPVATASGDGGAAPDEERPHRDEAPSEKAPDEASPPADEPSGDDGPSSPPEPAEPKPEEPKPEEPKPEEPPAPVQRDPEIEATEPSFLNGEVPKVDAFLAKHGPRVAACVAKHGGLTQADGLIQMQFLVRLRGRAEGVEVLQARGVTEEAQRCARKVLKNEVVGTPTADPTGVQFTYRLKRRYAK